MQRPVIGVMPLVDEQRESLWMLPGYFQGIHDAGGLPIMLDLTTNAERLHQYGAMCDGFLFTGGHDVHPQVYREPIRYRNVEPCPVRDAMEITLLSYAMARDMPVLGICRGIQLINAALGGTLYQDLSHEHPSAIEHHQQPPYDQPVHSVTLNPLTPLHDVLATDRLAVNSYHHQAIRALAPVLRAQAVSDDGLIEAIYHPQLSFLWAVQWHPEFLQMVDEPSRIIFRAFIEACEHYAQSR